MSMISSKSIDASVTRASPATQVCWIPDGETRLDREFARTTTAVAAVLSARRSRCPPRWETLLEAAVRDAELACDVESRYLRGQLTRVLTDRGQRRLREQAGEHGFVESRLDADGVEREYLVQHVGPSGREAELRISWYGLAPPVGPRGAAPHTGDRKRTPSPRVLRDAQRILALLTREFGRCGENPVRVTLPEMRLLLRCDADKRRGPKRALAALRALQELRFEINCLTGSKQRSYGALIGTITERPAGRGRSVDGDVYVQLGTNLIGCLDAFATPRGAHHPRRTHDFGLRPSSVGSSGFDILPTSCLPQYAVATEMTKAETAVCEWVDSQLTLTTDARSRGHREPNGSERRLREYSHADCKLLPRSQRFVAAYGHFRRNPERGFSLLGRRADGNGLVDVLLRPWRARGQRRREGKDITDTVRLLKRVVEDLESGVLAARGPDGEWISMTTALQLRRSVLSRRVLWVPFLPADFRERRRRRLEDLQHRRVLDGKSKYLVKVTPTPPLERVVPVPSMVDASQSTASATLPARLRAARLSAGLSQRELGRVFGVSATSVGNWERGFVEDEHGQVRGKRMSETHSAAVEEWLADRDG